MKTCKHCGTELPPWGRVYCSTECSNYAQWATRRERKTARAARPPRPGGRNKALADARTEVVLAEEALRVLRLEMEADRGTARPREASLAAADVLERGEGPHLAELREYGLTGRAMAIIQTGGGLPR